MLWWFHKIGELKTVFALSVASASALALTQGTHRRRIRRHQVCQEGLVMSCHASRRASSNSRNVRGGLRCRRRRWSISSQTGSIGAISGDIAGHSITCIFWRRIKSRTTCATWGLALSCCNVMICSWPRMKGKTCCTRTSSPYCCPFKLPSRVTSGVRPCDVMPLPLPSRWKPDSLVKRTASHCASLHLWWFCNHWSRARWWRMKRWLK